MRELTVLQEPRVMWLEFVQREWRDWDRKVDQERGKNPAWCAKGLSLKRATEYVVGHLVLDSDRLAVLPHTSCATLGKSPAPSLSLLICKHWMIIVPTSENYSWDRWVISKIAVGVVMSPENGQKRTNQSEGYCLLIKVSEIESKRAPLRLKQL